MQPGERLGSWGRREGTLRINTTILQYNCSISLIFEGHIDQNKQITEGKKKIRFDFPYLLYSQFLDCALKVDN
jgi:hypothetical protein